MQPSSNSHSTLTGQSILQGVGIVLMLAVLAAAQSNLLEHLYDWLQLGELSLLSIF